jgi:DNA-binding NarL/FixJ family response regulator
VDAFATLTERQREVAMLVGKGASNKKIANQLDITDRTVKAHLGTIFEKLGVKDRLQLALYVTKHSAGRTADA